MVKNAQKKNVARTTATATALVPLERIERFIYEIRGQKVMIDADLAEFYGVSTKVLNQAIKRNVSRFPGDFMFQLDETEYERLRSQIVTSKPVQGGRRYLPYAFTEHGALMVAAVLKSERAVQVSLLIIRAFVRLREILRDHKDLARRIAAIEKEFSHKTAEHEAHIARIYELLDDLMNPPDPPQKTRIGFVSDPTTAVAPHPPRATARKTTSRTPAKSTSSAHRSFA